MFWGGQSHSELQKGEVSHHSTQLGNEIYVVICDWTKVDAVSYQGIVE